jgi:hypothetical protein
MDIKTEKFIEKSIKVHGNPKIYKSININPICKISYGILYQKTLQKKNDILNLGYNLIEIWESDWKLFKKTSEFKKESV